MSFLETASTEAVEPEPVWPTLDPAGRDVIATMLARLIAKAVVQKEVGVDKEERDE
jgi:hypothetical protein